MAKPPSPSRKDLIVCDDLEEEESGWTSYFEDYFSSTSNSSPSLVSDAASCAACKFSHHHNHHLLSSVLSSDNNYRLPQNLPHRKLRFNKSRANHHQAPEDDPLEDTASSPLNSPKDGDLNPTEMISRKKAESTGKRFASEHISDLKRDAEEVHDNNTKGKNNINYTDMKKRGLTLFHLSMLVNYFG